MEIHFIPLMVCPMCPTEFETVWIEWNNTVVRRCDPAPLTEIQRQVAFLQFTGIWLMAFSLCFLCLVCSRPRHRRRVLSNGTFHLEEV